VLVGGAGKVVVVAGQPLGDPDRQPVGAPSARPICRLPVPGDGVTPARGPCQKAAASSAGPGGGQAARVAAPGTGYPVPGASWRSLRSHLI